MKKKRQKRKICLFSGKRGGFGAYLRLGRLIEEDPEFELQWLLGDMHTSAFFGETAEEVKKFFPKTPVELIAMGTGRDDTAHARIENLAKALQGASHALSRLKPDIVMVHGDRGEHLMVAFAGVNLGIVVGHTQGGETSGNIDDIQRHAITKLAHLHFPETEHAAEHIRQMGEEPRRVHVVGSLYIDRIVQRQFPPADIVKKKYGLEAGDEYGILIFHPDTYLTPDENQRAAEAVYEAASSSGLRWIATYPCSDPGYETIISVMKKREGDSRFLIFKNIENLDFLGLMAGAQLILGNSSAAFVEAPYFKLPAVNVGRRQTGRAREENVVDAEPGAPAIDEKIRYALGDRAFREKLLRCGYSRGDGQSAERILDILRKTPIDHMLLQKKFLE